MRIYAPVKDFNGLRNNVRFKDGVGETNDPTLLKWFEAHGYKVPVEDTPTETVSEIQVLEDVLGDALDFDAMTPNELRDWAKTNGYGSKIKNIRNKEKLLEIIRGE